MKRKPTTHIRKPGIGHLEAGASLLEFSIACVPMFMIIFFIWDGIIVFFHYHVLTDTLMRAGRAYAINYPRTNPEITIKNGIKTFIEEQYGLDASQLTITSQNSINSGRCTLRLNAMWENVCTTCTLMHVEPQAFSETIIEDECEC